MAVNREQPKNRFLAGQNKTKSGRALDFNPADRDDCSAAAFDRVRTSARASNIKLRAIQLADCKRPGWLCLLDNFITWQKEQPWHNCLSFARLLRQSGLTPATTDWQNSVERQGNLSGSRIRYLVQNGDTLESIAATQLGSPRLAGLLITINRGIIDFVPVNGKIVPSIRATQVIMLPSTSELAIHKKQFFTKTALHQHSLDTVPPRQDSVIVPADKDQGANALSFAPITVRHTAPLAVAKADVADSADKQFSPHPQRHYQVVAGDTLPSIALKDQLLRDVNSWILIAKLNALNTSVDVLGKPLAKLLPGQFLLLPDEDEVEQFNLIKKLVQIAELTGKKDPDLQFRFEKKPVFRAKTFMHQLSSMCRLQFCDSQSSFSMKLEVEAGNGTWTTIASYEFDDGKIMRHVFRADGSRSSLDIDLPAETSFEMAKQDFSINWNFYFDCFKRSQGRIFIGQSIAESIKDQFIARQ